MKDVHKNFKLRARLIIFFLLFSIDSLFAQQANPIFSSYNGQAELWGTESVTLNSGFQVSAGSSVLIYVKSGPFSSDQNFILRSKYLQAFSSPLSSPTVSQVQQSIQYFDRLGRLVQSIDIKGSPTEKDVIFPVAYDNTGQKSVDYLPYVVGNDNGFYKQNAINQQRAFYTTNLPTGLTLNSHPFAKTVYEESPLNRVIEQGAPGAPWQPADATVNNSGHTTKTLLALNNTIAQTNLASTRSVVSYGVALSATNEPTLVRNGLYAAKQLIVKITKGENWKSADGRAGTSEEYIDKDGRTLVQRSFNLNGSTLEMLSTYYVYDDWGNLTYVLPPATRPDSTVAPTTTLLNDFAYQYKYDSRGRKIEQSMPGRGTESFVYNQNNQLVASQNALQKQKKEWSVTKYDSRGRIIINGIWTNSNVAITRSDLQLQLDSQSILFENRTTTGNGYTSNAWPTTVNIFNQINYYDTYNVPGIPTSYAYQPYAQNQKIDKVPGQLTISKSWPTNDDANTLWSINYYNIDGQIIQTQVANHLGGKDILNYKFDFVGKVLTSQHSHTGPNSQSVTVIKNYTYDHNGRLLTVKQKTGNDAEITLSSYAYNEVGELIDKKLHQKAGQTKFLQSVDFRYNERGWLSSINDADLASNSASNQDDVSSASDLFGMSFSYNISPKPQYNGTISGTKWKTRQAPGMTVAPPKMAYDFEYDMIGQLKGARSSTNNVSDNNHNESINYDRQGNITKIGRWAYTGGVKRQIDSLVFSYSGNKHIKIDDISTAPVAAKNLGFVDGVQTATEYAYDVNGNIIRDDNKGISEITYTLFDLPQTILFSESPSKRIDYLYDRQGNKLQRKYTEGTNVFTTDYVNGVQYEQGQLAFLHTEEGRAKKIGTSYSYEYDLKDHLGSVRVSFTADPQDATQTTVKILQQTAYYPYGSSMYGDPNGGLHLSFVSGEKNMYLYNSKELQQQGGLNWYDHGSRMYDPITGRWGVQDPAHQFASPYMAMGNSPVVYLDPNGELAWFVVPLVGALVGGGANVAAKWKDIHNFKDGIAAFGIGAVAGAVGAYTGGAAITASGFTALGVSGGVIGGLASSATSGPILGLGNMAYFGDPYSLEAFNKGLFFGAVTGGITAGLGNLAFGKGANLWTGLSKGKAYPEQIIVDGIVNEQKQIVGQFSAKTTEKLLRTETSLWPGASGGRAAINGIEYTIHALERMQPVGTIMKGGTSFSRGIPPSVVENAIKYGNVLPGNSAAEVIRTFENVRVITNPSGTKVISVFKIGN